MKAILSINGEKILKKELAHHLPDVKSAHRAEAMARGLGYNSKIALDTARKHLQCHERWLACTAEPAAFAEFLKERDYSGDFEDIFLDAIQFLKDKPCSPAAGDLLPKHRRVTMNKDMTMEERIRRYIHNTAIFREDPARYSAMSKMYPHFDDDPQQIEGWFEEQASISDRLRNTIRKIADLPDDAEVPSPFNYHSVEDLFDSRGPIEPFETIQDIAEARGWTLITSEDLAVGPHFAINPETGELRQVFPKIDG